MQLFVTIESRRHVLPEKNGFAIGAKRSTHQPECRTGIFLGCCRRKHDVAFLSQHREAASFVWIVWHAKPHKVVHCSKSLEVVTLQNDGEWSFFVSNQSSQCSQIDISYSRQTLHMSRSAVTFFVSNRLICHQLTGQCWLLSASHACGIGVCVCRPFKFCWCGWLEVRVSPTKLWGKEFLIHFWCSCSQQIDAQFLPCANDGCHCSALLLQCCLQLVVILNKQMSFFCDSFSTHVAILTFVVLHLMSTMKKQKILPKCISFISALTDISWHCISFD